MNKEHIFQASRAVARAQTQQAALDAVWKFCGRAGIENFSFVCTSPAPDLLSPERIVLDGLPAKWRARYKAADYAQDDITVAHCRQHVSPLHWVQNKAQLNKINQQMFSEAAEFGIVSGLSYPFHGINGEFAVFNVSVSTELEKSPLKSLVAQYGVHLLGASLFDAHRKKRDFDLEGVLCLREKECLKMAASGKTSRDIAKDLHITERTVTFHFENARKKLSAASRVEAVSKALLLSLI